MLAHTLHPRTNAYINHPHPNHTCNIYHRLQPTRALPIRTPHRRALREPRRQRRSPELGRATAGREHVANSDILDEGGVDAGACDEGFEDSVEEVGAVGVFELTFAAAAEGSAEGGGYDDLSGGRMLGLGRSEDG